MSGNVGSGEAKQVPLLRRELPKLEPEDLRTNLEKLFAEIRHTRERNGD